MKAIETHSRGQIEDEARATTRSKSRGPRKAAYALLAGVALASALHLSTTTAVIADDDEDELSEQEEVRLALKRGEVLPLVRILAITEKEVPGDVVEVELEREAGKLVYEITVLTAGGRVREVILDARTGVILKTEDD